MTPISLILICEISGLCGCFSLNQFAKLCSLKEKMIFYPKLKKIIGY